MDSLAKAPSKDRADLFRETASRIGLPAALVEKDFWVCWTLKRLFSIDSLKTHILFKGGTSLSKIFSAIRRFSEDIDLAINFEMLGFTDSRDSLEAMSRSKREAILTAMLIACRDYVEGEFLELLRKEFAAALDESAVWQLRTAPSTPNSAVVEFEYPACLENAEFLDYVRPVVLLEPGTHAEFIPRGSYTIHPFAADEFPKLFHEAECAVEAITAERTFWEKATILHAEYHRPVEKPTSSRHSRHYYDIAVLAGSSIKQAALADLELLKRVVQHKSTFYYSAWARYDLAVPGTLRLAPPDARIPNLRQDYRSMEAMFFDEPPSLDNVISTLSELEHEINALA